MRQAAAVAPAGRGPGAVALDEGGRLAMDLPCVGCAYNLRGLLPGGRCPECGQAVGYATRLVKLGRRDPLYLRRVAVGVQWLIAGLVTLLASVACVPFWFALAEEPATQERVDQVAIMLLSAGAVVVVLGVFFVSTPHVKAGRWRVDRRQVARVGIAAGLALMLGGLRWAEHLIGAGGLAYWTAAAVVLAIGLWAALGYAAGLAGEIDHRPLARQARALATLLMLSAWGMVAYVALLTLPPRLNAALGINPALWAPRLLVGGLVAVGVLMVWALLLLLWYRKRLLEAARLAERLAPVQAEA